MQIFLPKVGAAVTESERHVVSSSEPGMLATQLFGRLFHYRGYKRVRAFLEKVEASKTGTWMRSRWAFPPPTPSSGKVLSIGDVHLVRYGGPGVEFVSFDKDENLFSLTHYSRDDDSLTKVVEEWKMRSHVSVEDMNLTKAVQEWECEMPSQVKVEDDFLTKALEELRMPSHVSAEDGNLTKALDELKMPSHFSVEHDNLTDALEEGKIPSHFSAADVCYIVGLSRDGKTFVAAVGPNVMFFQESRSGEGHSCSEAVLLSEHKEYITCVAMSCDGGSVVTGSSGGKVVLWNKIDQGWKESLIGSHEEQVEIVAISSGTAHIVSASADHTAAMWRRDVSAWNASVLQHKKVVRLCAVSKCAKVVVTCEWVGKVRIWNEEKSAWIEEVLGENMIVTSVAKSTDNNFIICGSHEKVVIWECDNGKWKEDQLEGDTDAIKAVAIREDNREVLAASFWDGTVKIRKLRTSQWEISPIEIPNSAVPVVAVFANKVVVGDFFSVNVWIYQDGQWIVAETFRVGGSVKEICLDETELRLRVKFANLEDGNFIDKFAYFIERNGMSKKDRSPDDSDVVWSESAAMEEKDWPRGLASMPPDWSEMYEVPSCHSFAVRMNHWPGFEIIHMVNSK